jgi:hypothetical protein
MIPYRARLDVVSAASGRARPWSQARGTVYVSVRHRPIFPYIKVIAALRTHSLPRKGMSTHDLLKASTAHGGLSGDLTLAPIAG